MARGLQISDSEWDVMEPIWAAGACTAADVIKQLRGTHDWNHSTIRTLLARLVEKGRWRTTSTDRGISTGLPSPADNACARKAARFWRRRSAATLQRWSLTLSQKRRWMRDQIEQLRQLLAQKRNPREKRK